MRQMLIRVLCLFALPACSVPQPADGGAQTALSTTTATVTEPLVDVRGSPTAPPGEGETVELVAAERTYLDFLLESIDELESALQQVTELTEAVRAEQALAADPDWNRDLRTALTDLSGAVQRVEGEEAPDRYSTFHAAYREAARQYGRFAGLLREAVEENDPEKVLQANYYREQGAELFEELPFEALQR